MNDRRFKTHPSIPSLLLGMLLALASSAAAGAAAKGETSPEVKAKVRAARPRVQVMRAAPGRPLMVTGKRGFLGLDLLELTPELRRHFGADEDSGVLVAHVEAGSPAAQAGVAVGDVLLAIDGKPAKSSWSLRHLIAPRKAGDLVSLDIVRNGSRRQLEATLEEREGRVLELGSLMQRGDGDEPLIVLPDVKQWEAFGEEMGRWGEQFGEDLAEAFAHPQVGWRLEREVEERDRLQRKIEALERRLRDLEKRLEQQPPR
jgi:membrane-associated protease RseP (regulator of RpoE activity)